MNQLIFRDGPTVLYYLFYLFYLYCIIFVQRMLMLSKMAPIFRRRNCGRAKEITTMISNMKILFIARLFWKCHHISIVLILLGYTQTIHEFWIFVPKHKIYRSHIILRGYLSDNIYKYSIHNNIHTIKLQSYWRWHIPHIQNPRYQNSRIWHIPVDI